MKIFDICLSFAGEDRDYVDQVANILSARGVKVFYDMFYEVDLWGKDLYTHLSDIYHNKANYCVVFISKHYKKPWTELERKSAQARALFNDEEYILPAKFDDTEIPGILPTTGCIDLRSHTPIQFAEIIIEKVNRTQWEYSSNAVSIDPLTYNFYSEPSPQSDIGKAIIDSTFQTISYNFDSSAIYDIVSYSIDNIMALQNTDLSYWTHGSDTLFDRIYATASVLTFLLQLGFDRSHPIITDSLAFLRSQKDLSLDNRANILFQLAFHFIDEESILLFLEELRCKQEKSPNSPIYGSFLLPQGVTSSAQVSIENWQQYRYHKDGASFHACHIADYLLHLQADYTKARFEAAQILDGIKHYIWKNLKNNSGFLLDLNSEPTAITLYAYALAPALHLALPYNWRECVKQCIVMLEKETNLLARCFGIMNLAYLSRTNDDPEIKNLATGFVNNELRNLWEKKELFATNARDLSIWGRSFIYGYRFLYSDSGNYFLKALYQKI